MGDGEWVGHQSADDLRGVEGYAVGAALHRRERFLCGTGGGETWI